MKKRFFFVERAGILCLLALFFSLFAFSQNRIISGKVTDSKDGSPLAGVSIQVKGKQTGVTTDTSGVFSINATEGATLVFSHTGYESRQVKVGASPTLNVQMQFSSNSLGEVVIIG